MAEKGLVIVYTGNGKGKTTAALGLGLRATGQGLKVFMIQFMKGSNRTGELNSVKYLESFSIEQAGRPNWVNADTPDPMDVSAAQNGYERVRRILREGNVDMVIMDEANVAVKYGLLLEDQIETLINEKPNHVHLVLTGRYASERIVELADLVSEVNEVKHPYKAGVSAQKGVEY